MPALTLATYIALLITIVGLWIGRTVWIAAFIVAIALGYAAGILYGPAIVWIALLAGACIAFARARAAPRSVATCVAAGASVVAILVLSLGLGLHVLPGFRNFLVARDVMLTAGAVPYTLYLNFDKAAIGILILGLVRPELMRSAGDWSAALRRAAPVIIANLAVLAVLGVGFGYLAFEPKWDSFFWVWAASNLFVTCLSEEAFFRAFLQRGLQNSLSALPSGRWIALGVASVLFGLAHFAGGPLYVVLATVAGAGYGFAYQRSGRIEMAMLAHFCLNATHFLLFTYPALASQA